MVSKALFAARVVWIQRPVIAPHLDLIQLRCPTRQWSSVASDCCHNSERSCHADAFSEVWRKCLGYLREVFIFQEICKAQGLVFAISITTETDHANAAFDRLTPTQAELWPLHSYSRLKNNMGKKG